MHTHLYIQIYICKGLYAKYLYICINTSVQIPIYILNNLQCIRMQLSPPNIEDSNHVPLVTPHHLSPFIWIIPTCAAFEHRATKIFFASLAQWLQRSIFWSDNLHKISALFNVLGSQLFEGIIHNLHQFPISKKITSEFSLGLIGLNWRFSPHPPHLLRHRCYVSIPAVLIEIPSKKPLKIMHWIYPAPSNSGIFNL